MSSAELVWQDSVPTHRKKIPCSVVMEREGTRKETCDDKEVHQDTNNWPGIHISQDEVVLAEKVASLFNSAITKPHDTRVGGKRVENTKRNHSNIRCFRDGFLRICSLFAVYCSCFNPDPCPESKEKAYTNCRSRQPPSRVKDFKH